MVRLLALPGFGDTFGTGDAESFCRRLELKLGVAVRCLHPPCRDGMAAWMLGDQEPAGLLVGWATPKEVPETLGWPSWEVDILESLELLEKAWHTERFDGLLGFSQGALMALIFLRVLQSRQEPPPFLVLASGFAKPLPTQALPYLPPSEPLKVASLHVYSEEDLIVRSLRSRELRDLFEDAEVYVHPHGHSFPEPTACEEGRDDFFAVLNRFITAQRA